MRTIELTETQKLIMEGKICPYCKNPSEYVDSSRVHSRSYGMIYFCAPCRAWCGVHKGTDKSLGRLSNSKLRQLKKEAHYYFDQLWMKEGQDRNEVYGHLANYLGLPKEYCHIGMFSEKTCVQVIEWAKMILNDLRRIDLDFGVPVTRNHYKR